MPIGSETIAPLSAAAKYATTIVKTLVSLPGRYCHG
jgi:hypothetical protein